MTWSGVLKIEKVFFCIDQKRAKKKKSKKIKRYAKKNLNRNAEGVS